MKKALSMRVSEGVRGQCGVNVGWHDSHVWRPRANLRKKSLPIVIEWLRLLSTLTKNFGWSHLPRAINPRIIAKHINQDLLRLRTLRLHEWIIVINYVAWNHKYLRLASLLKVLWTQWMACWYSVRRHELLSLIVAFKLILHSSACVVACWILNCSRVLT